jgi:hypothetical protein
MAIMARATVADLYNVPENRKAKITHGDVTDGKITRASRGANLSQFG